MIERELKAITEADLRKLIIDPVREGRTIEYKSELNLKIVDAKRKFLASVASFANAAGGDYVLGMETDSVDKALPIALKPLENFNPDADVLMVQEIIRRHIEPKVFTVEPHPVHISGGFALVIRIQKTWAGARMVTFNDDNRFYSRNHGGRFMMDVAEIRSAFTGTESATKRLAEFRAERLAQLVSGETPMLARDGPLLVIHFFALESFMPGFRAEIRKLTNRLEDWALLAPRLKQYGWNIRYSLEGPVVYLNFGTKSEGAALYTQVFQNGAIEFVDAENFASGSEKTVKAAAIEMSVMGVTSQFLEAAKRLSLSPPYYVLPSLLSVKGHQLKYWSSEVEMVTRAISHENIILPETQIDTPETDLPRAFRPLFDVMFNAFELPVSTHYDRGGDYMWKWRELYK